MSFIRFIPGDEVFDSAVVYPFGEGLRITANAADAGLGGAGQYAGVGMAMWMASNQAACTLLSGVIRAVFDPAASGGPAVILSVGTYTSVFPCDPRSTGEGITRRYLEFDYVQGVGFWLAMDGTAITATSTTGTDTGIPALTGPLALGCDISFGSPINTLRGGIAWFALERSPGIPAADFRFDDDVTETINDSLDSAWLGDPPVFSAFEDVTDDTTDDFNLVDLFTAIRLRLETSADGKFRNGRVYRNKAPKNLVPRAGALPVVTYTTSWTGDDGFTTNGRRVQVIVTITDHRDNGDGPLFTAYQRIHGNAAPPNTDPTYGLHRHTLGLPGSSNFSDLLVETGGDTLYDEDPDMDGLVIRFETGIYTG